MAYSVTDSLFAKLYNIILQDIRCCALRDEPLMEAYQSYLTRSRCTDRHHSSLLFYLSAMMATHWFSPVVQGSGRSTSGAIISSGFLVEKYFSCLISLRLILYFLHAPLCLILSCTYCWQHAGSKIFCSCICTFFTVTAVLPPLSRESDRKNHLQSIAGTTI